jgi:hypothetical protein
MKKCVFAIMIFSFVLCVQQGIASEYYDGMQLKHDADASDRFTTGKGGGSDAFNAGYFDGYVVGVAAAYNGTAICLPEGMKAEQVRVIVAKFVRSNPGKWHKEAHTLVLDALTPVFPCKKK